jgi:hypothetical protein
MDNRLSGLHLLTPAFGLLTALRGITALLGAHSKSSLKTDAFILLNVAQKTTRRKFELLIKMLPTAKTIYSFCPAHFFYKSISGWFFLYNVHYVFLWFLLQAWPHIGPNGQIYKTIIEPLT